MPELPEIQALSERLDAAIGHTHLTAAIPLQFSAAKTFDPAIESLLGGRVEAVGRRGKFLIFNFPDTRLLVHFSQGGRLDIETPAKQTRPKGGVLRLVFDNGAALLIKEFGTQRKAGWWLLSQGDDGPLAKLGPEPFDDAFAGFIMTGTDKRRVHTILRDQRTVAGIGRGFSDDILHNARISPYTSLASLPEDARSALLTITRSVLREALESERERTGGLPPKLGDRFTVHNRYGKPCPRCGDQLRRVWFEDYEITYCPSCQTGGKILADRRLSRLIK